MNLKGFKVQSSKFFFILGIVFCGVFGMFLRSHAQSLPVIISEVQIAGEKASYDFIELYNASDIAIDLTGYRLRKRTASDNESSIISIGATPENSPQTIIPAKGYFIWASSKDGYHIQAGAHVFTTQTIAADNSIALVSPSPENTIIDAVAWGGGLTNPFVWGNPYPQNPEASKSLSRWIENGRYRNSQNNSVDFTIADIPTPGQENASMVQISPLPLPPTVVPLPPPPPSPTPAPVPVHASLPPQSSPPPPPSVPALSEPSPPQSHPEETAFSTENTPTENQDVVFQQEELPKQIEGNVPVKSPSPPTPKPVSLLAPIISEFLPYPEENDAENEWIELYNPHNEEIDISGWKIKDIFGKTHIFSIPLGARMRSKYFMVFRRPQTSIVLNNDGDGIVFKSANGAEIDTIEYDGKAKRGYSYARKEDGKWSWTSKVTEGTENIFSGYKASVLEAEKDESQEMTADVSRLSASLASVNQKGNSQTQKFVNTLLIAGLLALFSSAGIIALKMRLRK